MSEPQTALEVVEEYRHLTAQMSNPDEDKEVRINAAKTILDRAGFTPWSRAEFESMTVEELEAQLARAKAELVRRGEAVDA
jgi:hypothetical protein